MKNILLLGFAALLIACQPVDEPAAPTVTNYHHQHIKPLVAQHCLSCHREGDVGLYPFETYDQTYAMGPALVAAVQNRSMPPWGHNPDCRPTENSLWLDEDALAVFTDWQEHGFQEGDAAATASTAEQAIEQTELPEPDEWVAPLEPYVPDVGLNDDYRCFILPHEFDETTFVYKNTIYPDRLDLVHHVIVYVGTPEDRARFERKDERHEGPGFPCFGGSGVDSAQMLGGWAPVSSTRRATKSTRNKFRRVRCSSCKCTSTSPASRPKT